MNWCDKTCKYHKHCWMLGESLVCEECIKCQPTPCGRCEYYEADRPHGEWVPGREISQMWTGDKLVAIDYEDFSCSCCGVVVEESTEPEWNFCPNCGADMRKEGDEK